MAERALITGADGFIGLHLASCLRGEGVEVMGIGLKQELPAGRLPGCRYQACDVLDREAVFSVVREFKPGYVFHLAAQSSVRRSWEDPLFTYKVALEGQANVVDAVLEEAPEAVVHVAGSAEEYGKVEEEELPIAEDHPLRPVSPYALSKVFQEHHALFCHRAHGLKVIVTRAFNLIGPGQAPDFVASDFARQVAEIEAGMREPVIRVGNLEARRDFCDVRELAGVFWLLVRRGVPGEVYNVCSGRDRSIRELLDALLSLSQVEVRVEVDPARLRPAEIPVLRGDNGKLRKVTGWAPSIPLERTLEDLLAWWREELASAR